MNLQTKISLQKRSNNLIDYNSNILLFGSCFSENIGKKLDYFKFQNLQNPFGILFHPKAIEALIFNAVNKKEYSEKDVFFHNEQWHCFDAHSKLSNTSNEGLLNELNNQIRLTTKQIHESTHVIITLGTSWVYRFVKTNGTWTPIHCIIPDIEPGPNEKYFKIIQKNCVIKQPPLGHKITLNAESPAGIYKIHFDCDVGGGAPGGVEFGIFIAEKPVPDVVGILTSEGKGTVSLTHFYEYNGTSPPAIEVMVKGVEGGHFVYILRTCFFVERVLMGTV